MQLHCGLSVILKVIALACASGIAVCICSSVSKTVFAALGVTRVVLGLSSLPRLGHIGVAIDPESIGSMLIGPLLCARDAYALAEKVGASQRPAQA